MPTMSSLSLYPITFSHLLLSVYALYLCYQNITRLRQYEQTSEKAAQWSNTAAEKLHRTRTTQATGTITLFLSLLTSLLFLLPTMSSTRALLATAPVTSAALLLAYRHMSAFWNEREQVRIPFVERFNEAVRGSEQVVLLLATLSLGWGVVAAVGLLSRGGGGGGGEGKGAGVYGLVVWVVVMGARVVQIAPHMGWKL